jgi:hypothetical protein
MKYCRHLITGFIFIALAIFTSCNDNEVKVKPCLATQFPFEDDAATGIVRASYYQNDKLYSLTYKLDDDNNVYESDREYDSKGKLRRINLYVNGFRAQDFFIVTHLVDTVKEELFRTNTSAENLRSYRLYFFDENDKVFSYTVREKADNFVRSDSVVYSYTGDNVTQITIYDADDVVVETYNLTYDDKTNPYYKTGFGGDDFVYSYLNQSKNNPISKTHVELDETITYEYTYSAKGVPLTRLVSTESETREFKYRCENP